MAFIRHAGTQNENDGIISCGPNHLHVDIHQVGGGAPSLGGGGSGHQRAAAAAADVPPRSGAPVLPVPTGGSPGAGNTTTGAAALRRDGLTGRPGHQLRRRDPGPYTTPLFGSTKGVFEG